MSRVFLAEQKNVFQIDFGGPKQRMMGLSNIHGVAKFSLIDTRSGASTCKTKLANGYGINVSNSNSSQMDGYPPEQEQTNLYVEVWHLAILFLCCSIASVVYMYTDVHFSEPAVSYHAVAVWDQGGSSWSQPLLWLIWFLFVTPPWDDAESLCLVTSAGTGGSTSPWCSLSWGG